MSNPRDLVLGTAGHIDHGKTALVRALTGIDTDRLPAEKQRGITIDLGFASLDFESTRLAIVDVPGHERFIRNMLAGATGLDLALLVVAADDSVMPQTREHLEILRLLGLNGGAIALTKCDLAEPGWLDLVEEEVRDLVADSFLKDAPIVRTSAAKGSGIAELRETLRTLAETAPSRDDPGLFRLAIDRSFTAAGYGTVVTGTVASGTIAVGDELEWWPEGRLVRVRGLQRHDRPVESLSRGSRGAINLAGVHHAEVTRGTELASPGYLKPSRILTVELRPAADAPRPLRHRARYRIHLGTREVSATLGLLERETGERSGTVLGQLFLAEPAVAVAGEPLIVREESPPATAGGGRVLEPCPRRIRRRDRAAIERIERARGGDPADRLAAALVGFGLTPWTDRDLCRETGLSIDDAAARVERLGESGRLIELRLGPRRSLRVFAETVAELEDRVLRALARLHAAKPRLSAIRREYLAAELADLENDALIAGLIDRLAAAGRVVADARSIGLKGHEPKLSQGERRLKNELAEAIQNGGFSPPDLAELTTLAGPRANVVADLLGLLADEQRIVEIGRGLYLDSGVEADLRRRVLERLSAAEGLAMSELRDALGTTRKFAVPIGEYLDKIGLTVREGDVRKPGPAASNA